MGVSVSVPLNLHSRNRLICCADTQYPVEKIISNRWEMNDKGVLECLYRLRWENCGKDEDTW